MASSTTALLKDIEHLMFLGKYNESLTLINGLLEKDDLSKTELLLLNFYKSDILNRFGEYQEALEIVDDVLKSSKGMTESLIPLDALIVKGYALTRLLNHKEAYSNIEKIEQLLETQTHLPAKTIAYRKALLLEFKWWFYFTKGEIDLVKETLNQFLSLAKKSGNKRLITNSLLSFAYYLIDIAGNLKLGEEHLEKALTIANEIDNDYERAKIYLQYTGFYARQVDYKRTIEFAQKGIAIAEKEGYKATLPMLYFFLGNTYSAMNSFDQALEYCLKALAFRSSASWEIYPLRVIGYAYHMKGELELAQEYYLKALEICKKIDEKRMQPWLLFNLISLAIDMNELGKAQKYNEYLQEFSYKTNLESVIRLHRFTSALILKTSSNMEDWIEAVKLLEKLIEDEELSQIMRFDISFALLEVRVKELQLSPNQAFLVEIQKQITSLLKEAKDSQYHELIVEIYRLKSQVVLLEYDAENAVKLLNSAKALAEEKGLQILIQGITKEQEQLEKQLGMWQQLQEKNTPLVETIKQVKLDNTVKRITRETALEKRDEKTGEIIEYRKLFTLKI
ncbi:MAG: tetratricopeptide repeat protein [Asgard group archaeon]|nr:tetratricopeptide repeat protein [Asgard group archaeon]